MRYLIVLYGVLALCAMAVQAGSPATAAASAGSGASASASAEDAKTTSTSSDTKTTASDEPPIVKSSSGTSTPADAAGGTNEPPVKKPDGSGGSPADAATTAGTGTPTGTPAGAATTAGQGTGSTTPTVDSSLPTVIIIDDGAVYPPDDRPSGYRVGHRGHYARREPFTPRPQSPRIVTITVGTQGIHGGRSGSLEFMLQPFSGRVAFGGGVGVVDCRTDDPSGVIASDVPHLNYTEVGVSRSEAVTLHGVLAVRVAGQVWVRGLLGFGAWRNATLAQSDVTGWYYRFDEEPDSKLLIGAGLMVAPGVVIDYDTVRGLTAGAVVVF